MRPVLEFSMIDPRFVESTDVLSSIDQRPNLMELTPGEFETLITNLFEKMGLETRLTQASRDGGVDCVAYDPRPIFGGKVVIQAKRYKNTVGVSAIECTRCVRDSLDGLTGDLDIANDRVLGLAVREECLAASDRVALDRVDRRDRVEQVGPLLLRRGTASAWMRSRRNGLTPPSLSTSTWVPSRSSRSCHKPTRSIRLRPDSISTKRSTSLPPPGSPRAIEPNTYPRRSSTPRRPSPPTPSSSRTCSPSRSPRPRSAASTAGYASLGSRPPRHSRSSTSPPNPTSTVASCRSSRPCASSRRKPTRC